MVMAAAAGAVLVLATAATPATAATAAPTAAVTPPSTHTAVAKPAFANPAGTPVLVTSMTTPPAGFRLTGAQVLRIASSDLGVKDELRHHPKALPYVYTKSAPTWQVSWFSQTKPQKELMQVYVDDDTGTVTQVWTGFQVPWSMARGYPGAFGRQVNAWYLWLPLCLVFVAPFIPWRRRPQLLLLDLLMLLGFSISLAFFNHAKIGLSVPLVYPFLIYLLARMLLLAFGKGVPREPLRINLSPSWLGIAIVFLMAFRIGLNVLNSNVIDVGYAGVIGADKLIHGVALYGHWPKDNMYGDTYGPVSYFLYVPFRLIFGWSGTWDSLPAAHAASIFFDLATLGGLFALGRRLKGNALGIQLAFLWAAYPFTLYALNSNTNDSLVAALLVAALLVITSAPARGAMAALAGLTKFAPFALAPLFARGIGDPPRKRSLAAYAVSFAVTVAVCMLPVVVGGDFHYFWHDSISYQSSRITPFSVWGLWGGLGWLQHILQGAAVWLAVMVAFVPARRGIVEVSALAAAVLIALQLTVNYWLYPYIVWFFPLVIVALLAAFPDGRERFERTWTRVQAAREDQPIPIHIATG